MGTFEERIEDNVDSAADREEDSSLGADLDKALIAAAEAGDAEEVGLLLRKGADIDAKDGDGCTALHFAAVHGYVEIVRLLLDSGADRNAKDRDGLPALFYAVWNLHDDVADLLIGRDAEGNPADPDAAEAVDVLCELRDECGPDPDNEDYGPSSP